MLKNQIKRRRIEGRRKSETANLDLKSERIVWIVVHQASPYVADTATDTTQAPGHPRNSVYLLGSEVPVAC